MSETGGKSEWTGIRGRIAAWTLSNPLRMRRESGFISRITGRLRGDETVLDIGAGSGFFSLRVAEKLGGGRVVCLDLSTEMLQRLRKRAEAGGLMRRIQVLQTDAASTGLPAASVDLAFTNAVMHELPDPRATVAEIVRVLKPGGALLVKDFSGDTFRGKLIKLFHKHGHGPFNERSLKALFTAAGLKDINVSTEKGFLVAEARKP